jgi:dihydrodipicolinate synthase/N-acetylneuraminate lyase
VIRQQSRNTCHRGFCHFICDATGQRIAGFAPELMIELVHACLEGDLQRAKEAQREGLEEIGMEPVN